MVIDLMTLAASTTPTNTSGIKQLCYWLVLILSMLVGQTAKSQITVTDVDLKSMYCIRIKLSTQDAVQTLIQYVESLPKRPDQLQELRSELDRINTDIQRLRDYLTLRARIIGITTYSQSAMIAANRGDADIASWKQCFNECGDISNKNGTPDFHKSDQCQTRCKKKIGDVLSRMHACEVINWLPF